MEAGELHGDLHCWTTSPTHRCVARQPLGKNGRDKQFTCQLRSTCQRTVPSNCADVLSLASAGWSGVLFIHQGYYRGAVLHFTLMIPSSYPSKPPSVTFESPVFHPLVDPVSGSMRLDWRFPTWRPREDCIWNVLHAMKAAFKRKALDQLREAQCANVEAYHTCVGRSS